MGKLDLAKQAYERANSIDTRIDDDCYRDTDRQYLA